ncbi:MAG: acyltransferase domain-containing protein [Paraburkholderia sp.]|nr:acyltransferase domain-containing protein [Paraburkholderia sp.]
MTIAILCSGQGCQRAGMFDLTGAAPHAADLFAHARALLGHDPREWVRSASADALCENRSAQILCTLQALAAMAVLDGLLPKRRCVAGYSVGEVAAWSVAGFMDALTTLDLVAARASAMDAATSSGEGMLFVRGLDRPALERLCADRAAALAIANPGDAYVLAGKHDALDAISADAKRLRASRIAPVAVSIASHTRLLATASPVFREALARARIELAPLPGTRLFCGIDGTTVLDVGVGLDKLARQIAEPVEWATCLAGCVEAGAAAFLELGPGRALAEMAALAYPALPARSLVDFRS